MIEPYEKVQLMKTLICACLMFILVGTGAASAAPRTVTLAVEGMTCASCPYQVEAALKKVDGVTHIEVSLSDKGAVVTFDDAKVDAAALTKATTVAGFPSNLQPDAITPAANQ